MYTVLEEERVSYIFIIRTTLCLQGDQHCLKDCQCMTLRMTNKYFLLDYIPQLTAQTDKLVSKV